MLNHFPRVERIRKALSVPLPGSRKPVTHPPVWAVLLLAVALVFFSALSGGVLSLDDEIHLSDPAIGETTCIGERVAWLFSSFHLSGYHPLQRIGYWIQRSLWNGDPLMFHIVSLGLHGVACLLAYALALRLKLGWRVAFLAALVFAVHPTRAEAVAWISAQRHLGAAFFVLLALNAYAPVLTGETRRRGWRLLLVGTLLLPALLYDSMAAATPLLLLVLDVAWRRPPRVAIPEKVPLLVVSALFLVLATSAAQGSGPIGGSWEATTATALHAPWWCAGRVLWPLEYSAHWWGARPESVFSAGSLVGGLLLAAVTAALTASLRRPWRRAAWLTLGWPMAFLAPVVCLLPALGVDSTSAVVADRHLYLALLGPCLALAEWCCGETSSRRLRRLRVAGGAVPLIALAIVAHIHTTAFRDTETLWLRSLAAQPDNPVARRSLADLLASQEPDASQMNEARLKEALSLLEQPPGPALGDQLYRVTRSRVYRLLGRAPEADSEFEAALQLAREQGPHIETVLEHSRWLAGRGQFPQAHGTLRNFPAHGPQQEVKLLGEHATVCLNAGDHTGYLQWNEKLLARSPFDLILWYNRERVARFTGNENVARSAGKRLDELCPPQPAATDP